MSRVVLLGCVSAKRAGPSPARDLYVSPLFVKRRAYAEATGDPWAILSAFHGLLMPDELVFPYDRKLTPPAIPDWAARVRIGLIAWLGAPELAAATLEVHAGVAYVDGVERVARWLGTFGAGAPVVDVPLRGLGIGKQLAWYGARATAP